LTTIQQSMPCATSKTTTDWNYDAIPRVRRSRDFARLSYYRSLWGNFWHLTRIWLFDA